MFRITKTEKKAKSGKQTGNRPGTDREREGGVPARDVPIPKKVGVDVHGRRSVNSPLRRERRNGNRVRVRR